MTNRLRGMERAAKRSVGQLVCVAIQDGSYYVGRVVGVEHGELIISGVKGKNKLPRKANLKGKAQVSGLFSNLIGGAGLLKPLLGGLGRGFLKKRGGAKAAGGGAFGMIGKIWSGIRIGFRMIKFIWPIFAGK